MLIVSSADDTTTRKPILLLWLSGVLLLRLLERQLLPLLFHEAPRSLFKSILFYYNTFSLNLLKYFFRKSPVIKNTFS
jgi:hypothetical protein